MPKSFFFDTDKVRLAMDEAERRAQSKMGAYVRTRAKSLLRRRKKISAPGSPPSVHSTDSIATLKNIRFGYDTASRSTVIGPLGLNVVDRLNGNIGRGTVPALHEFGGLRGVIEVAMFGDKNNWQRFDQRRKIGKYTTWPKRIRSTRYPARPFMAPALASVGNMLIDALRKSLR